MATASLLSQYELVIPVVADDIDALKHVNNVVYLRWVQDVATAHWTSAASAEDQDRFGWVVARHEIDYKAPAFMGDSILARTWVGGSERARFERHTELYRVSDRVLLARARTLWCPIDRTSGRPVLVDAETRARFSSGAGLIVPEAI
jgi:acyl-CoA thioester hydrolase